MPIDKSKYDWLDTIGDLPRMIVEARRLVGTHEARGSVDNPTIMDWAKTIGGKTERVFTADSVPWCGVFMAYVAKLAGKTPPTDPYWALNWGKFGQDGGQPELGDVLTFLRKTADGKTAGHVALYVGEDPVCFHILGGNQEDQVCFTRIDKGRLRAVRQPPYMNKPASARPYVLRAAGSKSTKEA